MRRLLLLFLLTSTFTRTLFSHHSLWAEFDSRKPVTLTGVVTKIAWMNPHARFSIDVRDAKTGKTSAWILQLSSPNALGRLGWTRDSLKAGDVVTVIGSQSKENWSSALAAEILFSDGHKLFGLISAAEKN